MARRSSSSTAKRKPERRSAAKPRRTRKPQPSVPALYARIPWLRAVALALGIAVLLAHAFTARPLGLWLDWLHVDWPDIAKHFSLLGAFAWLTG